MTQPAQRPRFFARTGTIRRRPRRPTKGPPVMRTRPSRATGPPGTPQGHRRKAPLRGHRARCLLHSDEEWRCASQRVSCSWCGTRSCGPQRNASRHSLLGGWSDKWQGGFGIRVAQGLWPVSVSDPHRHMRMSSSADKQSSSSALVAWQSARLLEGSVVHRAPSGRPSGMMAVPGRPIACIAMFSCPGRRRGSFAFVRPDLAGSSCVVLLGLTMPRPRGRLPHCRLPYHRRRSQRREELRVREWPPQVVDRRADSAEWKAHGPSAE